MKEDLKELWTEYIKYLEYEKGLYLDYLREQGWLQHAVILKEHQPSFEGFMTWVSLPKEVR